MTGRQLQALFGRYNEQYFGGRLPAYAIHTRIKLASRDPCGMCSKKRRLIEIQRGLSDPESIGTLLHEMAHAATSGGHSIRWAKEMIRLRELGAPLSGFDRCINDLAPWEMPHLRVTKEHLRAVARDVFVDQPDIPLTIFLRWLIYNYGGPAMPADFIKKYPWVRAAFRDAKREWTEMKEAEAASREMVKQAEAPRSPVKRSLGSR